MVAYDEVSQHVLHLPICAALLRILSLLIELYHIIQENATDISTLNQPCTLPDLITEAGTAL